MSNQDKYTRSSKGQPCQVRVPGVCKQAPENETTVPAHLNGAGMGIKHANIHFADCCDACHAWLDGGYVNDVNGQYRDVWHLQAIIRTQIRMIEEGVLKL